VLLAGCDANVTGSYPATLNYPARTDPIVTDPPGDERFYADQPGTVEKLLQSIGPKEKGGVGGTALNPADAPPEKRQELTAALQNVFGTPAAPTVAYSEADGAKVVEDIKSELSIESFPSDPIKALDLDAEHLSSGSQHYRRHCMTCHGVPGDGRGPTGPWVNPHPRDYRKGAFKFMSTDPGKIGDNIERKPHRADLLRTLNVGVDGTTMPSFSLLPGRELDQLVSYIIHLSIRGEVEMWALTAILKNEFVDETGESSPKADVDSSVKFYFRKTLKSWAKSNLDSTVIQPAAYPYASGNEKERLDSVRRGYVLFTNTTLGEKPEAFKGAGCIACHQDFGRQVNFKYDQWGTLVRPANLTVGAFRGGRRPIDIYWRVRGGIVPSQMPLVELKVTNPDGQEGDELDGKKYWDLVNFIQAVPYKEMLPPDVRAKVYPETKTPAEAQHAAR
jgi:mono/diheme cytochrome c family protein